MSGPLKRVRIENHKGIVSCSVDADGKSLRLEGANGTGKSSFLDALDWIVNDDGSEAGMRNGAERRYGEMLFGEYLITRSQKRGGKPTRNTPAAKLAEVRAALTRKTFSMLSDSEQVEAVKRIAPGLDVSALEASEKRAYDERTGINRDAKMLRAQAEGVKIPDAPAAVGEERPVADVVDVAAIAAKKGDIERRRAENAAARAGAKRTREAAIQRADEANMAARRLEEARAALAVAEQGYAAARRKYDAQLQVADQEDASAFALVDPDASAIDSQIASAREKNAAARAETEAHNRTVRAAAQAQHERKRAEEQRARLSRQAADKEADSRALTLRIEAAQTQRAAAIAEATKALPLPLTIASGSVCFDGVAIRDLNTAARIRLDVAMAATAGHKLMPVRDASLLDEKSMAELTAFAAERGIQLLSEIVKSGAPLTIVIEDEASDWT